MSDDFISATPKVDIASIEAKEQKQNALQAEAAQITSDDSFTESCESAFNPWAADKDKSEKFKSLNDRKKDVKEVLKESEQRITSSKLETAAEKYQQKNPELNARSLIRLLQSFKKSDSLEEMLKKVQDFFPDQTIADEAFEFLIENADEEIATTLTQAKDELNKRFGRQIVAGKNIAAQAREFSEKGIGKPTALRDLYRDITGNPREPTTLFGELSKAYSFNQLKTVVQFLLHSMGSDLKCKGCSIPRGELARLFTETRSLQAILGVYRFFQSRMRLIRQSFHLQGLPEPKTLSFEDVAKLFMKLLEDRYPAPAKIIKTAEQLGYERDLLALMIIISQWRDGIRNVSPRLFKILKQKEDLLEAILKALEELEDEQEKQQEDKEDEPAKKQEK